MVAVPSFNPFIVIVLLPLEPVVSPIDAVSVLLDVTLVRVTVSPLASQVTWIEPLPPLTMVSVLFIFGLLEVSSGLSGLIVPPSHFGPVVASSPLQSSVKLNTATSEF